METLKKDHCVRGLDAGDYKNFEWQLENLKDDGHAYDMLIHCGAVSDSNVQGNHLWQMNYQATCELGKFCEERNMRMIFMSSGAAIDPDTSYGWSKKCAEYYLNHTVMGLNLCILRPYNIWGFDEEKKQSPSIVYKIMTGQLAVIYKNCERDFVYVEDVVTSIHRLVSEWQPGTFEIGSCIATEIESIVSAVFTNNFFRNHPCYVSKECPITLSLKASAGNLIPGHRRASDVMHYIDRIKDFIRG